MSFEQITSSLFEQPPSPTTSQPCTPSPNSHNSDSSESSSKSYCTLKEPLRKDMENPPDSSVLSKGFGTPIQKFTQELPKTLARFSVSEKLSDKNFMRWSQSVKEAPMSLDYLPYLKKRNYTNPHLSDIEHKKVKFILTTWLLSLMDAENVQRCRAHLTVRSNNRDDNSLSDEDEDKDEELAMTYEPAILWKFLWKFLRSHHQSISESSLIVIDTALHDMKISPSDSLVTHSDKFNNLMLDFYQYRGKMSDIQSARLLIKTVGDRLSETTRELIHQTVKPLTRQGVSDYLK